MKGKTILLLVICIIWLVISSVIMNFLNTKRNQARSDLRGGGGSEVEYFNSMFYSYEGVQKGSSVCSLLNRLCANAETYTDYFEELNKIPNVIVMNNDDSTVYSYENMGYDSYVEELKNLIHKIKKDSYYKVATYTDNEFVNYICINYNSKVDDKELYNSTKSFLKESNVKIKESSFISYKEYSDKKTEEYKRKKNSHTEEGNTIEVGMTAFVIVSALFLGIILLYFSKKVEE